jgi:hypothetical protein
MHHAATTGTSPANWPCRFGLGHPLRRKTTIKLKRLASNPLSPSDLFLRVRLPKRSVAELGSSCRTTTAAALPPGGNLRIHEGTSRRRENDRLDDKRPNGYVLP